MWTIGFTPLLSLSSFAVPGRRGSWDQDRLAEGLAGLHRTVRGDRLGQREALTAQRLHRPLRAELHDLRLQLRDPLRTASEASAGEADERQPAPEQLARAEIGQRAAGEAEDHDP